MPRGVQLGRVFALAQTLARHRRGLPAARLAEISGVALRTLYRDLHTLQLGGCPLHKEEGRWRFTEGWQLHAPPGASTEEIAALYAARQLFRPLAKTTLDRALDELWARLTAGSGSQLTLLPPPGAERLAFPGHRPIEYGRHKSVVAALERAIRDSLVVSCRYRALHTDEVTARDLEPSELRYEPATETLYCFAWCRLRQAVRIFAVQRFLAVVVQRGRFAPRPEARSAAALAAAFRIYREGRIVRVCLRFRGQSARLVTERVVRPGQSLERLAGREVRLSFDADGLTEIGRWVLGFGAEVVVEAPAELRDLVRGALEEAAARYDRAEDSLPTVDTERVQSRVRRRRTR